jgi:Fe-S oxidoreductase/FAD/FMN-containing dehydrogenase
MAKVSQRERSFLENKFGNRVAFSKTERILYGHDIASIPGLIKPFIGNTTPDAVVQPEAEAEIVEIVRWASEKSVPLTPRGKATSGYGGVLPVKKGVVVDFHHMQKIIGVDKAALTVTVQPGITWEKLDFELKKQGLTLRLYPSSYPGSTVGGWLAQGGSGIGSYEYGEFKANVTSARVVLPDSAVREFTGSDLDLIADAEGITGLISQVTVRVMPLEDMKVISIGIREAQGLQHFMQLLINEKLPIWSVLFINPRMAELKNKSPLREHAGQPAEKRVTLPIAYITTITFRAKDHETIMGKLPQILKACNGEHLSNEIAQHEWENRFNLMVVKRLGPSLVPTEMIIPLDSVADALTEIGTKVRQPVVKEGVLIREGLNGKPEVVILGFIPSDQRKFGYNLVFALTLTIMKIAEKHGGRPYATGIYFAHKAAKVLGVERLKILKEYKHKIDPRCIINPGKVTGNEIAGIMNLANVFEPFIRPFGNSIINHIGEQPMKKIRDIPADVAWFAYACSQCGYCVPECDEFYGSGWESQSPRGRWYWLREYMEGREKWSQHMVDSFLACTTCELCNLRCSANLPIEPSWMKMRGELVDKKHKMTFPPFEMMAAALRKEGDIWAGYRKDRSAWFPADLKEKHGPGVKARAVYFAGCTASYVENDIAMASVRLLDRAGIDFTFVGNKESCCGTPMLVAGKWEIFAETMKKNIAAVRESGADTVITSCPACDMMWRHTYTEWAKKLGIEYNIKTRHYSEIVAEKIKAKEFVFPANNLKPVKVTWHDSCHIGRVSGVYEEPRELIKAIPNVQLVEMAYNRKEAHCCGSVLTLIKDPPVAAAVGKTRLDEAIEAGAEKVLALCPCCEFQFRVTTEKKKIPVETVDLARFACAAMGYDFPDPNPEVQKQWAVFEAMIALMTPRGFANLMGTMWPEMIGSMPFGMGHMMLLMGKIPGALNLMKPMFPVLFPILLPMMMPKVMSTMLDRVGQIIPMPDYMREQMPELMPKVMDNLMPHMIGDLIPLVTQPMIDYLSGKQGK